VNLFKGIKSVPTKNRKLCRKIPGKNFNYRKLEMIFEKNVFENMRSL